MSLDLPPNRSTGSRSKSAIACSSRNQKPSVHARWLCVLLVLTLCALPLLSRSCEDAKRRRKDVFAVRCADKWIESNAEAVVHALFTEAGARGVVLTIPQEKLKLIADELAGRLGTPFRRDRYGSPPAVYMGSAYRGVAYKVHITATEAIPSASLDMMVDVRVRASLLRTTGCIDEVRVKSFSVVRDELLKEVSIFRDLR